MTPHLQSLLEYWYMAQAEPLGLYIKTSNYDHLTNKLYLARSESNDLSLKSIQLRRSPRDPTGEIWLVNTVVDDSKVTAFSLSDLER